MNDAVKVGIGMDVLTAARLRVAEVFSLFERVYLSFSGGKDSTVLLHLVAERARQEGRRFGLLFIDLEAQYRLTVEFVEEMYREYADCIDPWWLALPLNLRNAVSQFEPQWCCWEPGREDDWVRKPPKLAITDGSRFPWYRHRMEFEELVIDFGHWYGQGKLTACLVGIRCDESLNRWRTIASTDKQTFGGRQWTTWKERGVYNAYPIYDWRDRDVWRYSGREKKPYNRLYDLMHQAGLSIHQQRICQPYGDDQRRGLWLYHVIEPETWGRVVARVQGANSGALYVRETGNILGNMRVQRPPGHTWQSFAELLLSSMPTATAEHFRDKIAVFLRWHHVRGVEVVDEADAKLEAAKEVPSWRRICKSLLRNDYWCKGLSFSQHKSESFEKYRRMMKRRRMKTWGPIYWNGSMR